MDSSLAGDGRLVDLCGCCHTEARFPHDMMLQHWPRRPGPGRGRDKDAPSRPTQVTWCLGRSSLCPSPPSLCFSPSHSIHKHHLAGSQEPTSSPLPDASLFIFKPSPTYYDTLGI